jgi:hypothetical protein
MVRVMATLPFLCGPKALFLIHGRDCRRAVQPALYPPCAATSGAPCSMEPLALWMEARKLAPFFANFRPPFSEKLAPFLFVN